MGQVKLQPVREAVDRESFADRYYSCVKELALKRTKSQEQAEELAQEVFYRFYRNNQDPTKLINPVGYLHRMVRYVHFDHIQESIRMKNILSYDSMTLGFFDFKMNNHDENRKKARADLIDICRYACVRKASSRIGSIFILRFFYDYYPSDIARLIKSPRPAIDNNIQNARKEANLYMQNPGQLKFISKNKDGIPEFEYVSDDINIFARIVELIALCCRGKCFSPEQLYRLYQKSNKAIKTTSLSHIVSCPDCFANVLAILNLPPIPVLSTLNYPKDQINQHSINKMNDDKNDSVKRDDDDFGGPNNGGGTKEDILEACRKRDAFIKDHRPYELRIFIDHFLVKTLQIENEHNFAELQMPYSNGEFIQIRSERGVRLLLVDISGKQSLIEDNIYFNDDRILEFKFNPQSSKLYLNYVDPLCGLNDSSDAFIEEEKWYEKLPHYVYNLPEKFSSNNKPQSIDNDQLFGNYYNDTFNGFNRFRFATITLSVLIFTILSFVFFRYSPPAVSAAEILAKASIAEIQQMASEVKGNRILHRIITVDEKILSTGQITFRHKLEHWLSSEKEVKKVFDVNSNNLIFEASRIIESSSNYPLSDNDKLLSPGEIWRIGLTIQSFKSLIEDANATELRTLKDTYVLEKKVSFVGAGMRIVKASMILRKADLHPIEQVLQVQVYGEKGLREYRFKEIGDEYIDIKTAPSNIFSFKANISTSIYSNGSISVENGSATLNPPSLSVKLSTGQLADLMVDILYALDSKGGLVKDDVNLQFTPDGVAQVNSIVQTNKRKVEILSALSFAASHPAIKINIQSEEEIIRSKKLGSLSPKNITPQAPQTDVSSGQNILEEYFAKKLNTDNIGTITRAKATYIISISKLAKTAHLQAWGLSRLIDCFSSEHLKSLSPKAREKWKVMVINHLNTYSSLIYNFEQELQPLLTNIKSDSKNLPPPLITDAEALRRISNKLIKSSFSLLLHTNDTFLTRGGEGKIMAFAPLLNDSKSVIKTLQTAFN